MNNKERAKEIWNETRLHNDLGWIEEALNDAEKRGKLGGYIKAVTDYGIWSNGVQYIGCMETPISKVIARVTKELE